MNVPEQGYILCIYKCLKAGVDFEDLVLLNAINGSSMLEECNPEGNIVGHPNAKVLQETPFHHLYICHAV